MVDEMVDEIAVEIAYALPAEQVVLGVSVAKGTTARQAIRLSGLCQRFPELDLAQLQVGIFGQLKSPDSVLQAHDRVEIYRPLTIDPQTARRRRAAAKRVQGAPSSPPSMRSSNSP